MIAALVDFARLRGVNFTVDLCAGLSNYVAPIPCNLQIKMRDERGWWDWSCVFQLKEAVMHVLMHVYHVDLIKEIRIARNDEWVKRTIRIFVTNNMSLGIDYREVRFVIHQSQCPSMIDFSQESGRMASQRSPLSSRQRDRDRRVNGWSRTKASEWGISQADELTERCVVYCVNRILPNHRLSEHEKMHGKFIRCQDGRRNLVRCEGVRYMSGRCCFRCGLPQV